MRDNQKTFLQYPTNRFEWQELVGGYSSSRQDEPNPSTRHDGTLCNNLCFLFLGEAFIGYCIPTAGNSAKVR